MVNTIDVNDIPCILVKDCDGTHRLVPVQEVYAGESVYNIGTTPEALHFLICQLQEVCDSKCKSNIILAQYDAIRGCPHD